MFNLQISYFYGSIQFIVSVTLYILCSNSLASAQCCMPTVNKDLKKERKCDSGKFPFEELFFGELSVGEMSSANCPLVKLSIGELSQNQKIGTMILAVYQSRYQLYQITMQHGDITARRYRDLQSKKCDEITQHHNYDAKIYKWR